MKHTKLEGIVTAMITPFDSNGRISESGIAALCDFLIEKGVNALFPGGSTGEGVLLSVEERKQLAELVLKHAQGRVPVVIHTGTNLPHETLELTKHAESIGAAGAAMIPPFYYGYDDKCLLDYFGTIAEATPQFPLYLYHIPINAKNDIKPALVKELVKRYPNIVGLKDSSQDYLRFLDYVEELGEDFTILMGSDCMILSCLIMDGKGGVTANSTAFPEPFVEMYKYFKAGDLQKAKEMQMVCAKIRKIFRSSTFLTCYKVALGFRGIDVGTARKPLREMSADEQRTMRRLFEELGVLR